MRRAARAHALDPYFPDGGERFSLAAFGLTLYLFTVHSFKLPLAPAAMALGVLGALGQPRGLRLGAPLLWFLAWLTWVTATSAFSYHPVTATEWVWEYAKIGAVLLVAVNATRTPNQVVTIAGFWLACFIAFPMRGQFLNFLFGYSEFGRYGWIQTFKHFNDLAAYGLLAVGLAGFLWQLQAGRPLLRKALLATIAALVLLISLTQSRGGFVALAACSMWYLARSRQRVRYAIGVLAVAGFTVLLAPKAVWERFGNMKYLSSTETLRQADSSAEQRWLIQQVGWSVFLDNAAFGVGIGTYPEVHERYAEERDEWQFARGQRDTHNLYLNLAAETGIPGLLLFLGFVGSAIRKGVESERALRKVSPQGAEALRALRFGFAAYLLGSLVGTFHRSSFVFVYAGLLFSAAEVLPALARNGVARPTASVPTPGSVSRRRMAQRRFVWRQARWPVVTRRRA